ncbi:MAG: dTDP-4-dehydrorhamnose 3,5-epimerase family protein [Armatimonadota bacterium]|nr:dTDP-4-dehydrorhamnose 3,5-epimerase family protein [Armatimonadota bacterium]
MSKRAIIQGVEIKQLRKMVDERGYLMEMLRADDAIFDKFGQCYVALNYPGVIRAWHYHKLQIDFWVVVKGEVKVGLYDAREDSPTKGVVNEFFLGENNPVLLKIPIGVLHGYKTVGVEPSLLLNFPTQPYNPAEPDEYRTPYDTEDIPYDWDIVMV